MTPPLHDCGLIDRGTALLAGFSHPFFQLPIQLALRWRIWHHTRRVSFFEGLRVTGISCFVTPSCLLLPSCLGSTNSVLVVRVQPSHQHSHHMWSTDHLLRLQIGSAWKLNWVLV